MIVGRVKTLNVGYYINCTCCSIFHCADDILLLAHTISALRALLSTCENYLNDVDMCTNAKNHSAFGYRPNTHCAALTTVSGWTINSVDCCRYIGVFFNSGCTFKCRRNFVNAKSCFLRAFNAL